MRLNGLNDEVNINTAHVESEGISVDIETFGN